MRVNRLLYKIFFDIYKIIPFKTKYVNVLKRLFAQDYEQQLIGYINAIDSGTDKGFWMCWRIDGYIEGELNANGLYGGFEKESLKIWAALCANASVILDIGANTGVFSLLAKCKNSNSFVIAVEPIDVNFNVLQKNIMINNYDIRVEKVALSEVDGTATMYMLKNSLNYMTSVNVDRYEQHPEIVGINEVVSTEVLTKKYQYLEDKYNINKIDLIKIDVEGHEFQVLSSMSMQIKKHKPTVLFEVIGTENAVVLNSFFKAIDYQFICINEHNKSVVVDNLWDNDHHNFLACDFETIKYLRAVNLVA